MQGNPARMEVFATSTGRRAPDLIQPGTPRASASPEKRS